MIAWLGMYDMAPLRAANDRYWSAIRSALGYGPRTLNRDGDAWAVWQSPALLLAQTCGLPYRSQLHREVTLVATPDYGLPGCPPGHYTSVIVVRQEAQGDSPEAFADGTLAYGEALSQSGWAAPATFFAARGLRFDRLLHTGAHAASVHAVAAGRADIAGIDALTWELLRAYDPVAARLRVIATTAPTPALPYITAAGRDPAPLRRALRQAVASLSAADRATLHLRGIKTLPASAYLSVPTPPSPGL
ncbi:MAG: PhnD/SsuA/transferrin family substrate-binding protein [Pseudodonghicola sp.]|nr:PhnD/SsuA/transferrin family substrate-binding protein [Pseudodonghicola sp.]